jgi:hypothetical protein
MGAEDESTVTFEPADGGAATVMRVEMQLSMRFGVVGRVLERLGRGKSTAELVRELERFAAVVCRPRPELEPGRRYSVDSGAGFRLLDVHELEGDIATVSLFPGVSARRPEGVEDLSRSKALDPLALQPIGRSIRATARVVVEGQPAFLLDGGHGTYPFRATIDLLADARPELLRHEVATSPVGSPPTAVWGREVGLRFAPLVTLQVADQDWGVAKVLKTDLRGVHLRLYSERWTERPSARDVDPGALSLATLPQGFLEGFEALTRPEEFMERAEALGPGRPLGVGHMPVSRADFGRAEPKPLGLVTLAADELRGYEVWKAAKGGYFEEPR